MTEKTIDEQNMKEFLTYAVENKMMRYQGAIQHECPNCKHKYYLDNIKPFAVDSIVNYIMELAKKSKMFRQVIIAEMAERIKHENH